MNILLASSEALPYSKTGGLADMVGALAKFLARAGHQVRLITPLYRGIREQFPDIKPFEWALDLPMDTYFMHGHVWQRVVDSNLTVYFVDQPHYFDREGLYQGQGADYADNAERFIFFCKSVVNLVRYLPWRADIVHVHDWQTALIPVLLRDQKLRGGWANIPSTCLTLHNLAYQGNFPLAKFGLTNLPPDYLNPNALEFYGVVNPLKGGIVYSDFLTTVSPRYAREITTEMYGCGLDGILRQRQNALFGILNGVDYEEWNTQRNPHLPRAYSTDDLAGKQADKLAVQKEMGLPVAPDVPLFGTVSRLAEQKGVDIQLTALQEMLAANMQCVFLGSGNREYERAWKKLADRFPTKCAVKIGFDTGLSHRIEAGSDFYLMPSKFEPCGLNQMYSLRYGTVPIVRVTGGLDDAVTDISEDTDEPDGIKFSEYSVRALAKAIRKALVLYQDPELLAVYRQNGMSRDFSWERTAQEYSQVYRQLPALAAGPAQKD